MELFKILGTIAINNTDANKKLSETSKHAKNSAKDIDEFGDSGEKSSGKLSKFFSGVGKAAGVAGKAIATGLAAGAGAVAGLATAAIKSYADYEQLVGGAQLLFGDAFGYVEEKAKNAYKTVQMSTNEYLQQVNGFSTGLKTALGGNEQAAAELAHKIIVAEADIIAATGNSAENVQNAFNGIMKSNFTMLDNLQLGITPTKEGFQEVIDKVNEWNKANGEATSYQIDNLADCQAALVDYVEMQGLAGYAANEAAGTIQGSWGMLKGAWSNLLVGFSDPSADLQSLINGVFESVTAFAGNLMPRISQVLTGIATAFETLVPMIVGEIPGLIEQILPPLIEGATALVQGLVNVLPSVLNTLMAALPALIEGVMSIVDALIGALPGIMQALVAALPTLIPLLIDAVVGMIMMLVEMLPQIIQPIIDYLPEIIVSIVDALLGNLPVLIQGCVQLIGALIAALPQILVALWDAIKGIFGSLGKMIGGWFEPVKKAVSNAWAAMGNVPGLAQLKKMVEQVWGAIKTHISTVINAIKDYVTTYWNAIKNVVSTVLESIKNIIQTAWNAIKTIISSVMQIITSMLKGDWEGVKSAISNILNAIKSVISSIWNGIKNTISSVMNGIKSIISSAWNGIKSVVSSSLNTIKSIVSSVFNGIKSTISSVWNGIKNTISSAISDIKSKVSSGFNQVKSTITNAFSGLPAKLKQIGSDLVTGLWNGISNKFDWLTGKIKGFASNVTEKLKNFFGIKSPSRVWRDEVGKQLAEGVAVGITQNTSSAVAASEDMANATTAAAVRALSDSDIDSAINGLSDKSLKAVSKKFEELSTYNNLSLADEVAFWEKAGKLYEMGTDDRLAVDKKYKTATDKLEKEKKTAAQKAVKEASDLEKQKMEAAKNTLEMYKLVNDLSLADEVAYWGEVRTLFEDGTDLRIEAEKEYLSAKKSLNDQILEADTELQDKLDDINQRVIDRTNDILHNTDFGEALHFDDILGNLKHEVFGLEQYDKTIADLEKKIGGTAAFEDIKAGGLENLNMAYEMAYFMPEDKLLEYVELWDRKVAKASTIAQSELADEVATETTKAFGEWAATMDTLGVDVLDSTAAMEEGVTGNFVAVTDSINNASSAFTNLVDLFKNTDWAAIIPDFTSWLTGSSDSVAAETSMPYGYLVKQGTDYFNTKYGTDDTNIVDKVVEKLGVYNNRLFKTLLDGTKVYLDTGALVGELVVPMDEAFGKLTIQKERGR